MKLHFICHKYDKGIIANCVEIDGLCPTFESLEEMRDQLGSCMAPYLDSPVVLHPMIWKRKMDLEPGTEVWVAGFDTAGYAGERVKVKVRKDAGC